MKSVVSELNVTALNRRVNSNPPNNNTSSIINTIAAELRAAYADVNVVESPNGLSIAQSDDKGFPLGLIMLNQETFYLNLGLAEFEVVGRQTAMDFLLIGCSSDCRLRTKHVGGRLKDWFLDIRVNDQWLCVHAGGFMRFASSWSRTEVQTKMNSNALSRYGREARDRVLQEFTTSVAEPLNVDRKASVHAFPRDTGPTGA